MIPITLDFAYQLYDSIEIILKECLENEYLLPDLKQIDMNARRMITILMFAVITTGLFAQDRELKVKIVDLKDVSTVVTNVSTSSSSSCDTSDFPVYQGSSKTDVNFADLKSVIVRHDKPAEDSNNYITVELLFKDGKSGLYEMIRHIRFTGESEKGDFSIKVLDVNIIDVLEKYY